jgi:hypothetical protein
MNAEQQQQHFNEIAEMMADNKITTEQACSLSDIEVAGSAAETDSSVKRKIKYTPAHLKAQNKYREKNRGKYNEAQRLLYEKKIQEEEWKKHYLERSRVNNRKYRDKKKQELVDAGDFVEKKRGRPRKVKEDHALETKDIKNDIE